MSVSDFGEDDENVLVLDMYDEGYDEAKDK